MKTSTEINKNLRVTFGIMFFLLCVLSVLLIQTSKVEKKENSHTIDLFDIEICKCVHNHKSDYEQYDIPDGYSGPIYTEDFFESDSDLINIQSLGELTIRTTCEGMSNHGPGREDGYGTDFLAIGCINYRRT